MYFSVYAYNPLSVHGAKRIDGNDNARDPACPATNAAAAAADLHQPPKTRPTTGKVTTSAVAALLGPGAMPEYVVDTATKTTYLKGKFLGKGGFARVYEFTDLTTNIVYAGKIISKSRIAKPYHKEKIAREIDLHRKLNHENIVKFHHFFSDDESVYIILENCSYKSLIHVLKNRGKLSEPEVRYYLHQLLLGIGYIHKKKVIHRDLKLGNMFLTDDLVMKIGDFGLATRMDENETKKVNSICGTPNYIAPEILKKQDLSHKADIWAVGCIMYAMLVGHPPFEMSTLKETYAKITSNAYAIPPLVSTSARSLIATLLQADPKSRPDASAILTHDFFKNGYFPKSLPISSCTQVPKFTDQGLLFADSSCSDKCSTHEVLKISCIVPKLCKSGSKGDLKGTAKDRHSIRSSSLGRNETLFNGLIQKVNNILRAPKLSDKKSKCTVVSELLHVLSTFMNVMPAESSANLVVASASPILFVSKWIDYSNKYGFGFELCDRSVCMLLNDSVRIGLSPDRSQLEIHEPDGQIAVYVTTTIPPALIFHYKMLKYLAKYMDEKLTEGGKLQMKCRHWPPPHMSWWMRTDVAIIMQLNTGALQVNFFNDHTKLILSKSKDDAFFLTFIDEKQQPKTYLFLQLIMLGCPYGLRLKLKCLQQLLNHFIQITKDTQGSRV